jgi:hypothetical protein
MGAKIVAAAAAAAAFPKNICFLYNKEEKSCFVSK